MSCAADWSEGKVGEKIVRSVLESSGKFESVWDCSEDTYFQSKDIDLLGFAKDGHIAKYEVKTDRQAHETGNIVWEHTTSGNIGCLAKSEADFIMYYIEGNGRLYCFNTAKMRAFVKRKNQRLVRMGDNAEGYLLNINELIRAKMLTRIQ